MLDVSQDVKRLTDNIGIRNRAIHLNLSLVRETAESYA